MIVELIAHTTDPLALCEEAAAMCTQSDKPAQALRGAIRSGHESVLEHASFTFRIEGISRITLAQLTRHRIASFSVLSQRYVGQSQQGCVIPSSIASDKLRSEDYKKLVEVMGKIYDAMLEVGIPKEDARYILPQGTTTNLIMTMNARELGHFFSLRCCNSLSGRSCLVSVGRGAFVGIVLRSGLADIPESRKIGGMRNDVE